MPRIYVPTPTPQQNNAKFGDLLLPVQRHTTCFSHIRYIDVIPIYIFAYKENVGFYSSINRIVEIVTIPSSSRAVLAVVLCDTHALIASMPIQITILQEIDPVQTHLN